MTHAINTMPSLYLEAGAIHGCVLCKAGPPVCYTEDVGRHNAVDKIAGWIYRHGVDPSDKILYTTGRLTSEMVIKTVRMGIPILVSRSGFTAMGRRAGTTGRADPLVGPHPGQALPRTVGEDRIVLRSGPRLCRGEESARHKRKGENADDLRYPACCSRAALARRMGGGDKPMRNDRRPHHPRPRHRASRTAMRRADPQRQWRPGARFEAFGRACGRRRRRQDYPGPLAGIPAALDWMAAQPAAGEMDSQRGVEIARSCRAILSQGSIRRAPRECRTRGRRLRRLDPPGHRALERAPAP